MYLAAETLWCLEQWSPTWGKYTPGSMRRHLEGYAKTSDINKNETRELL
jgi:hypothetical protein